MVKHKRPSRTDEQKEGVWVVGMQKRDKHGVFDGVVVRGGGIRTRTNY